MFFALLALTAVLMILTLVAATATRNAVRCLFRESPLEGATVIAVTVCGVLTAVLMASTVSIAVAAATAA